MPLSPQENPTANPGSTPPPLSSFNLYGGQALWFPVLVLVAFGFLFVYSASSVYAAQKYGDEYIFVRKQLYYLFPALIAAWFGLRVPLKFLNRHAGHIYLGMLGIAALTKVPGVGRKVLGASRWVSIGGFQFQPSEFLKVATVIFAAHLLSKSPKNFLQLWPIPAAFAVLLSQPDFGSSVILMCGLLAIILMHGTPKRFFGAFLAILIPAAGFILVAEPYRVRRLISFIDPFKDPLGAGFQVIQSFVALANGGWTGKGLGASQQKLFFLPEAHTDFILAVIGEEMGFLGILIITFVYLLFFYAVLQIIRHVGQHFERLLATGIFAMFASSMLVNMGVVVGFLPTKGLPLPFVSHGGTALIASMFMVGLLSQLHRNAVMDGIERN